MTASLGTGDHTGVSVDWCMRGLSVLGLSSPPPQAHTVACYGLPRLFDETAATVSLTAAPPPRL